MVALGQALPRSVVAAPAPPPASDPDLAAFEAGFAYGQAMFDRGRPLEAARTWLDAARHLPETTANRDNRIAVYEYIADAFEEGLTGVTDVDALREAATALQAYCDGFTRAYGTETKVSPKIDGARERLQQRLRAAEEAAANTAEPEPEPEPAPEPEPEPSTSPRPWRGLTIGGAVTIGVGVGAAVLAAVQGARGNSLERAFDDPKNNCFLDNLMGECAEFYRQGKTANATAIAGLVLAPLLIGGGAALLAVGARRRSAARSTTMAPVFAPGFAGVSLRRAF